MSKYRTKPFEIEAIKWTGDNANQIRDFATAHGSAVYLEGKRLIVTSRQGEVRADIGDMIIAGVGETYPCKPDIFDAKYELIE